MQTALSSSIPGRLENITRRWWFYLILVVVFFLPAYASQAYDPRETPKLVMEVLANALIYKAAAAFPLFKLLPVALLVPLLFGRERFSRPFLGYAGLNLLLIAVFQNMAVTPDYGFVLLTGNLVVFALAGAALLWSAARGDQVIFARQSWRRQAWWRYWVIPAALLAFWFPANTGLTSPAPDFSLARLAANEAGLTGCMMLPVYLAVLSLAGPEVNRVTPRVCAFIGLVTGLLNVVEFFANTSYGWWLGGLHLPLLLISIYVFALSLGIEVT